MAEAAKKPATRLYRVCLQACKEMTLEAMSAEDAWERYKAALGITGTVHVPQITEV